ncbi:MAG: hypothetical protein U0W24_06225 [Bacteroidales bacterium]
MKKLAFFVALMVGLNANSVVRRPEDEEMQVIVTNAVPGRSKAAWIQRLAAKLRACFYGITFEGDVHEINYSFSNKHDVIASEKSNSSLKSECKIEKSPAKSICMTFIYSFINDEETSATHIY